MTRKKQREQHRTGAEEIVWDLSDLYASPDDPVLEKDCEEVLREAENFAANYRGKVENMGPESFFKALQEYEKLILKLRRIGSYAQLVWSADTGNARLGKLLQRSRELGSEVSQKLVFFDVEWIKMEEGKAREWVEAKILRPYRHYLRVSRLYKPHTLNEEQEQILSAKAVTGRSAWNRFFDETFGNARFLLDGEELTSQQVLSKLHSGDRNLRKRAHGAFSKKLSEMSHSLTFVFNTILADKSTDDGFRGYEDWIHARHLSNQTDPETVNSLIRAVTGRYDLVQRYYRLKQELLGIDALRDYDRYAPLGESRETISWEGAKGMVLDAYSSFHSEMGEVAEHFFNNRWIDAAIRPGKRGGAYSASTVADLHPYIFMNYDGQPRDVQTLAHELGHGVHQYLSRRQGELQSGTPLTTAETASVFGEMLVFDKLMQKLDDPAEKLALLVSRIDDTVATVFRQISMNRFEDRIHNARRKEGELESADFSRHWLETQKELYGDSVEITEEYGLWWSYIPHFLHTPGYVYAYAFGELLVLALYKSYRENPEGFPERYMDLLRAGGSDWPHRLIASLEIDIRDPEFWHQGLDLFEEMIEEAEDLAREVQ
ncbi:MAG: M3 family oligoendopeptidase [Balneolaceae bacterium]